MKDKKTKSNNLVNNAISLYCLCYHVRNRVVLEVYLYLQSLVFYFGTVMYVGD